MKYEIVKISPKQLSRAYKYEQIAELAVGEGFHIPWCDMSSEGFFPAKGPQQMAYYWAEKLDRKHVTRKDKNGLWIMRTE
jgi:hypothetical protein